MQRWIKRALFHLQHLLRGLLNPLRHAVSMQRPAHESLQNQHLQRPLNQFARIHDLSHKCLMGKLPATASVVKSIDKQLRVKFPGQRNSPTGNCERRTETWHLIPVNCKLSSVTCSLLSELQMFVVVWQFEIAEEKIPAFEAAYGLEGAWAKLFRTSPQYIGTELLRDAYIPGSYLTIDRWASEEDFRAFRKDHDTAYEALDRSCDPFTSRETRIGAYTT